MYDASTLRWMTRDPIEFKAGQPNLYEYVGNSPTNTTDPSGEFLFTLGGAAVGFLGGLVYGGLLIGAQRRSSSLHLAI